MQTMESIQLLKEQLKIKSKELKQYEKEKAKVHKKIKDILRLNQQKLSEFKTLLDKKDEEIKHHQQIAWAARAAKHLGMEKPGGEEEETEAREPLPSTVPDPKLLKQLEELKKKEKDATLQAQRYLKEREKLLREKTILVKELKRLRLEVEDVHKLQEELDELKEKLNNLEGKPSESSTTNYEQLIREKDDVIESYEKMLYGDIAPEQEGMLPSEIIQELREELELLEDERKRMIIELEQLKEENTELAMKLNLSEEKDATDMLDTRMNVESRGAQTAEFSAGLESFLITYSDMITLLLVIFVLLYTVSKLDEEIFAEALSSFQEKEVRIDVKNFWLNQKEQKMFKVVRRLVKDNVDPETLKRGDIRTITVSLPNADLFDPGSADLIEGAEQTILGAMEGQIHEGVKQVIVEGHTDDVPLKNKEKFPSNWELSAARAASVARVIIDQKLIAPDQVVVSGYGEFRPLKPNTNDTNRAINRRVEIKILKDIDVIKEEEAKQGKTTPGESKEPLKEPAAS